MALAVRRALVREVRRGGGSGVGRGVGMVILGCGVVILWCVDGWCGRDVLPLFEKAGDARLFWVIRFASGTKVNGIGFACLTLEVHYEINLYAVWATNLPCFWGWLAMKHRESQ